MAGNEQPLLNASLIVNGSFDCDLIASASFADVAAASGSTTLARLADAAASATNKSSSLVLDALEYASFLPPPCEQRFLLYVSLIVGVLVFVLLALPSCLLAFAANFSVSRLMVQGALSVHSESSRLVRCLR